MSDVCFCIEEVDLLRQWFDAVQDAAPGYHEDGDRKLYAKILNAIGQDSCQGEVDE